MKIRKTGSIAFLFGIIIAIITAIFPAEQGLVTAFLVIAGLAIGFLNITGKEVKSFLIASIALLVAGTANMSAIPVIGSFLESVLNNISVLVAPAAIVVAIAAIWALAYE